MEYVPGLPITEYCDQKKLNIRERIELFIEVCEGVQHAHQKAIIHRDLKPANILVVEVDGKPMPRIIDFGLAKAVTLKFEGETFFTQMGDFVGTPGYMSPEQADPGWCRISTRARTCIRWAWCSTCCCPAEPFDASEGKSCRWTKCCEIARGRCRVPSTKVSAAIETCSLPLRRVAWSRNSL